MKTRIQLPLLFFVLIALFLPTQIQAQNALEFDGVNDYVQTTFGGVLGSANRTFEAWVKVDAGITTNSAILDYGLNAVGSRNTFLINPNYQLVFISGGTNANISSSNNAVTPGQWNHVAFVLENGTGYLFVNANLVGFGNLSSVNTPPGNANMTIGQRVSGGSILFEGAIDEVRVWDVARTPTQIMADMNSEFCAISPNLKAYYKFNQGVANGSNSGVTTLIDNSGNGNNGSLFAFSLSGTGSNWVPGASLSTSMLTGGTDTVANCIPFLTPGNQVLTTSGIYQDTVQTPSGCDSIYSLDFTALSSSSSSLSASACDTWTSPGGQVFTATGTYADTLVNAIGCDSIITVNLTISASTQVTLNDTACDAWLSPGGNVWNISGTYQDTILNAAGCDSVLTINLVVFNSDSSTVVTDSSCGPYLSAQGNTYSSSGTYTEMAQTVNGCDSLITLNLSITNTDTSVGQSGNTLSANQAGVSYQWYDCDSQAVITGATSQSFTPSVSGNYAVILTNGACVDTSSCRAVSIVGMEEFAEGALGLYPNPTSGMVTLELPVGGENLEIRVLNAAGKLVKQFKTNGARKAQFVPGEVAGLYSVLVMGEERYRVFRVLLVD